MIGLTSKKMQGISFIDKGQKKIPSSEKTGGIEYFGGISTFAQELNIRIKNIQEHNNQVERTSKEKADEYKRLNSNNVKSKDNKMVQHNSNNRIHNKSKIENNQKTTKEIKASPNGKGKIKIGKKTSLKKLKELQRLNRNEDENKAKSKDKLENRRIVKLKFILNKNKAAKLKSSKNKKDVLLGKSSLIKSKPEQGKDIFLSTLLTKERNNKKIAVTTGKNRKVHLSGKKIKLKLKIEKYSHKEHIVKVDKSVNNDPGKDSVSEKLQSKEINSGFKGETFQVLKKYDFSIPEVVSKTNNFIYRNADEIFGEIVKHFTFVVNRGGGEAKLSLYPPELGKIKMNIKLHDGKVSTFFLVDNQTVKELIDAKLNVLQQHLLEQGFTLGSFDVGVRDESESTGNFKKSDKDIIGLKEVLGASIPEGIENPDDSTMQAVLPWLSSYINITV